MSPTKGLEKLTPELGQGKERSVTYESFYCKTDKDIDVVLNRDKYAYSYIYWNPQAVGVILTLCKPNPKSFEQKFKKQVQRGLLELSESDATKRAIDHFSTVCDLSQSFKQDVEAVIAKLYDNGYTVAKKVDEEKKQ